MSELICPECQYKNDPEATYCEECGVLLEEETREETEEKIRDVFEPGDKILDRYEILSVHQSGDFDSSYLTVDLLDNSRKVWIKQRYIEAELGDEYKEQEQLCEKIRQLPHKNVLKVLDTFRSNSSFFTVFEYLDGQNLQMIMDHSAKAIPQELVLELAIQTAEGLKFLHSHGILHRDIQPAHLFLTRDGVVKITGFSRVCSTDSCPADNAVTDGYSPPEAYGLMGGRIDERSDIFSLGVTLYSLLVGKAPKFSRESFFNFVFQTESTRRIDPALEYILIKALKKEPTERFGSVEDLLDRIRKLKRKGLQTEKDESKELILDVASKSHVGKVRAINQDSCLVSEVNAIEKSKECPYTLIVVADGMGGEAEGDKASSMAIRVIAQEVMRSYFPIVAGADTAKLYQQENIQERSAEVLKHALARANKVVFDYSREDPARRGMGSTISAALIQRDNVCICHAGDTRGYVFNRKRGLIQLTEDHSLVGRLVRMGQMTREEAQHSPQRSAVYRALGTTPELEVDVYQYKLRPGDYLLLCSDGVWEYFSDQELVSVILEEGKTDKILDRLINICLERGADDNATAIIVYSKDKEVPKEESKTQLLSQVDRIRRAPAGVEMELPPQSEELRTARAVFPPRPISDRRLREEMEKQKQKNEIVPTTTENEVMEEFSEPADHGTITEEYPVETPTFIAVESEVTEDMEETEEITEAVAAVKAVSDKTDMEPTTEITEEQPETELPGEKIAPTPETATARTLEITEQQEIITEQVNNLIRETPGEQEIPEITEKERLTEESPETENTVETPPEKLKEEKKRTTKPKKSTEKKSEESEESEESVESKDKQTDDKGQKSKNQQKKKKKKKKR